MEVLNVKEQITLLKEDMNTKYIVELLIHLVLFIVASSVVIYLICFHMTNVGFTFYLLSTILLAFPTLIAFWGLHRLKHILNR